MASSVSSLAGNSKSYRKIQEDRLEKSGISFQFLKMHVFPPLSSVFALGRGCVLRGDPSSSVPANERMGKMDVSFCRNVIFTHAQLFRGSLAIYPEVARKDASG